MYECETLTGRRSRDTSQVSKQYTLCVINLHLSISLVVMGHCDHLDLLLDFEHEMTDHVRSLGENALFAVFFVVVEDLLHRLELTMHDEGLQAQAHIMDVQA